MAASMKYIPNLNIYLFTFLCVILEAIPKQFRGNSNTKALFEPYIKCGIENNEHYIYCIVNIIIIYEFIKPHFVL